MHGGEGPILLINKRDKEQNLPIYDSLSIVKSRLSIEWVWFGKMDDRAGGRGIPAPGIAHYLISSVRGTRLDSTVIPRQTKRTFIAHSLARSLSLSLSLRI